MPQYGWTRCRCRSCWKGGPGWGKERREQRWLKLHITVGCRTTIITSVEVTPGNKHDSPFLPQMVKETAENFPNARQLAADLGYLSHENLAEITGMGLEPLIPMKINSVDNGKDPVWSKLFAYFTLHREDFMARWSEMKLLLAGAALQGGISRRPGEGESWDRSGTAGRNRDLDESSVASSRQVHAYAGRDDVLIGLAAHMGRSCVDAGACRPRVRKAP